MSLGDGLQVTKHLHSNLESVKPYGMNTLHGASMNIWPLWTSGVCFTRPTQRDKLPNALLVNRIVCISLALAYLWNSKRRIGESLFRAKRHMVSKNASNSAYHWLKEDSL